MSDETKIDLADEIRNLHAEITSGMDLGFCVECAKCWPCPTVKLADWSGGVVSSLPAKEQTQ